MITFKTVIFEFFTIRTFYNVVNRIASKENHCATAVWRHYDNHAPTPTGLFMDSLTLTALCRFPIIILCSCSKTNDVTRIYYYIEHRRGHFY